MMCLPMSAAQRTRRMKRWIFTILLFLLVGAIVNILVAWGCAFRMPGTETDLVARAVTEFYEDEEYRWEVACWEHHVATAWGVKAIVASRMKGMKASGLAFGTHPRELLPAWSNLDSPTSRFASVRIDYANWSSAMDRITEERSNLGCGWPLLVLWCDAEYFEQRDPPLEVSGALVWGNGAADIRVLPLRLIWPGFIINTLFYGVMLWLLIPGPFVLRRLIRIKRGRCPKCGYDLRGQPPEIGAAGCPECGWNRQTEATA